MLDIITSILSAAVILSTPILFSALGEAFDEKAGVLNMGIEGIMALAAFISLWVTFTTGSYLLGLLAAILVGSVMGAIHSFACVTVGINQLIAGLMIYSLADGISNFSYRMVSNVKLPTVTPLARLDFGLLSQIPVLGQILFQQNALVYLSFFLAIAMGYILYRTSWGLKIRAAGENPDACDAAGIDVNRVRHVCAILGGTMAGLGGVSMSLGYLGIYQSGIVAGRGWIAIVVVILARWSPFRAIMGSFVFGLGYSIAATLMGAGVAVPYYLLLMLPYVLAVVVILFFHKGTKSPSALTIPFRRR